MATPLTPSKIGKLQDVFGAALRKADPPNDEAQDLIENHWHELEPELMTAFTAAVNRVLERMRNTIVVEVEVDYDRPPQAMVTAIGRRKYVDGDVVAQIPRRGQGRKKVKVEFFRLGHNASDEEVKQERAARGLVRDEYAQAAVNEKDGSFADEHPNSVSWQDANSNWCYLACDRYDGERHVYVSRSYDDWDDYWWFAGVRKSVSLDS